MNNTRVEVSEGERGSFIWKENDGYLPAGAISSTISDMATYLKIYLDSLLPYSDLALTSLKTFETTSSELDKFNLRTDEMAYSWVIDSKNNIIWHNGGTPTYNSYIGFSRDLTKGVVILANFGSNEQIPVTLIGPKMLINMMGVN
ncbi:MAG: beta-lactamase family protein [Erysipelotrichaceae bacterium]|nr:beta-lactamase family protein [Erysipelotrichaceae bacterium]